MEITFMARPAPRGGSEPGVCVEDDATPGYALPPHSRLRKNVLFIPIEMPEISPGSWRLRRAPRVTCSVPLFGARLQYTPVGSKYLVDVGGKLVLSTAKFHHVGIATAHLEKSIAVYQSLGYSWLDEKIFEDPLQNVRIAFLQCDGHPLLELVAPVDSSSPVANILKKSRSTPYHTCYEVPSLDASIQQLKALRFLTVVKPVPAVAFGGRAICFLYHHDVGLVELLASPS